MLKEDLTNASRGCIHHDMLFTIESVISDYAIAAILSRETGGFPLKNVKCLRTEVPDHRKGDDRNDRSRL